MNNIKTITPEKQEFLQVPELEDFYLPIYRSNYYSSWMIIAYTGIPESFEDAASCFKAWPKTEDDERMILKIQLPLQEKAPEGSIEPIKPEKD